MRTTKQHGAETKLAEGYSQPAQQGDVTAIEVVQSVGSVATPTPAAVRGDSGEILMAAGVSQLRPLAAQPEAFFDCEASAPDGRGEYTLATGGANVASRPLTPPSGGRLDTDMLLNAITLPAGGAALAGEFMPQFGAHDRRANAAGDGTNAAGKAFAFGYDCAEGAPQTLSGDRGIRTGAVVMGVADVS